MAVIVKHVPSNIYFRYLPGFYFVSVYSINLIVHSYSSVKPPVVNYGTYILSPVVINLYCQRRDTER